MPLDAKFATTAGQQRFREQIMRENKSRLISGARPSEAALQFIEQRNKHLRESTPSASASASAAAPAAASSGGSGAAMGSRGTAGRSGVASSTQRHVVDEGYDMVLQTEWRAATEGVNAQDSVFRELNGDNSGAHARTLHVQREESARRVSDTRARMLAEQASNREWQQRAHAIVEEGWHRARECGLSVSRHSATNRSDLSRVQTQDHLYTKMAPETAHRASRQLEDGAASAAADGVSSTAAHGGEGAAAGAAASHDFSSTGARMHRLKGVGLASSGVRAPTFTAERHRDLCAHMRGIYAKPPPPPRDIFVALEKVTKASVGKRELSETALAAEQRDREEMQRRMERLKRELEEEREATARMNRKLEDLKAVAKRQVAKK